CARPYDFSWFFDVW
nr:immunoglobulin heavy chain junction region [Mus musculus]MBK4187114.1 immunoglobulin heavy chain junction region [Mus musculus]MBK4195306.1 immunoglobulin heavy chain junction region [Mus musculus]